MDAIAAACATHGVADLGDIADLESCLLEHHACLAIELVRTVVPRAPELLGVIGRSLGPADCPAASAAPQ